MAEDEIRFLRTATADSLTITCLKMTVSEDGPSGFAHVDFTATLGDPVVCCSEDGASVTGRCKPAYRVEVREGGSERVLADFELETIVQFSRSLAEGEAGSEALFEELFLEGMLTAYSLLKDKVFELTGMSPMRRVVLPNADEAGMRAVVRRELKDVRFGS